jgi:NAD(P)-dependent dehydrogenase (short-subunit alcohol dehydrogenase family)
MTQRIALVSGANTGIGFEVVRSLAQLGMIVYLGSRDVTRGRDAAAALKGEGDIRLAILDLTDERTINFTVETIEKAHGRLDVLVNNAGVAFAGNVLDAAPEVIRESFEANLHGPVRLTQLAVPLLRKSDRGRVVNVSSGASLIAWLSNPGKLAPQDQLPYTYCAAKAALNAATVMQAGILKADGIKVNAANPGHVKSQVSRFMGPKSPADGAKIIVHLATLDDDGPTGGFFDDKGPIAW